MSASTPALTPLSLSLSLSLPLSPPQPTQRRAAARPAIGGRLNARASFSLTSLLETAASSSSSDNDDHHDDDAAAQPPPPEHGGYGRCRRRRSRHTRIARPKDAMPGFRRRRHFAPSSRRRSAFAPQSRAAPGGAAHFDRAVSAATYYGHTTRPDAAAADHVSHQPTELDSVPPPMCTAHAEPAVLLTCRRAGANRGRRFYKCARKAYAQCDFFRWADDCGAPLSDAEQQQCSPPPPVVADAKPVETLSDEQHPDALRGVLRRVFGHHSFRAAQQQAIRRLLSARSTVALMPTGGGKSLIYQMYAALRPGLVVVITPLLSLMHDQLQALPPCLPGACVRGGQPPQLQADTERRVCAGEVKILFISPERLFSSRFRRLMGAEHAPCVSLVVVDEAHCISHWSHNFRVAYLRIPQALFGGGDIAPIFKKRPLVLALTATATRDTLTDVCASLETSVERDVVRSDCARANLVLSLSRVRGDIDGKAHELVRRFKMQPFASILGIEKEEQSLESKRHVSENTKGDTEVEPPRKKPRRTRPEHEDDLSIGWGSNLNVSKRVRAQKNARRRKHTGSLIVYVSKQRDCEAVKNYLRVSTLSLRGKIEMYHAGMAQKEREKVQAQFEKGSIAILVATVAFGMGLNFSNVRGVIHFDLPPSLEAYWQEVGRAGRQGEEAYCTVLFSSIDLSKTLSRSHSDGMDKSQIRQFLRTFLSSTFEWKSLSQRTRTFVRERAKAEATCLSDECTDADENVDEDDDCGRRILRMTEYNMNRKLDMRFETAETICAILERELDEFHLLRATNTKVKVQFFSKTADALIKSASRAIKAVDRMVVAAIAKHGSQSNGQYCLDLSDAGFQEVQVIRSLKRLQDTKHITFELHEKGIEAECSADCFAKLEGELDKWVQHLYKKFEHIEAIRVQKARVVARTFSKADELLSDSEQSEFVHNMIEAYFKSEQREVGELTCTEDDDDDDDDELVAKAGADRIKQVRNAAHGVMDEESCGMRMARTGRQIARILHGMDSSAFRAKDWYSQRSWGRFVDVGFEQTKRIASEVVRERHWQQSCTTAAREANKTG